MLQSTNGGGRDISLSGVVTAKLLLLLKILPLPNHTPISSPAEHSVVHTIKQGDSLGKKKGAHWEGGRGSVDVGGDKRVVMGEYDQNICDQNMTKILVYENVTMKVIIMNN